MVKTKDGFYKQIGTTEGNNSYLLLAGGDYVGFSNSSGSSTIVQRDANGYIANNYFYTSGGGAERNASSLGYIAGFNTSDYYIRSYTSAAVKTWLGLGSNAYTSTAYLPLSGGTMTGNIILKGSTSADMTDTNIHPRLRFDNSDSSQTVSFIFTDYDAYRTPAGIKLIGNQGNEWFEAPNLIKTGSSDSYVLLGGGGHRALSTFTPSLVTSTTSSGVTNVATTNTNTYLNIVQGGASAGSSTQVTGTGSVTVSSDASGKLIINGIDNYLPLSGGTLTGQLTLSIAGLGADNFIKFKNDTQNCYFGIRNPYGSYGLTFVSPEGTYNKVWHSGNDGAGSGLDADLLDGLQYVKYLPYSCYNNTLGILVTTEIPATSDAMFIIKIIGNDYSWNPKSIDTTIEFYNYNSGNAIVNVGGTNHGSSFGNIKAFNYNGKVCFWFQQANNYQTYKIFAYTNTTSNYNVVESITNAAMPTTGVTREVTITPKQSALVTDNVESANRLKTARTIAGVSFDGTVNISIPFVNLSSKPTTLSGYGITDALLKSDINVQVGGTKNSQMSWASWSNSDVYGGAIQIREYGFVGSTQSGWYYSPAITFHWGNRAVKRFGMRSDGQLAIDDSPILSTGNYSNVLDSRYRPMRGSWAGNSVPGTREFGFTTNDGGGEVAFKSNSGTMNMIIDGNIYVTDNSYQVIHAGNIGSQSVNYATSAGKTLYLQNISNGVVNIPGTGQLRYDYHVNNGTAGLFPTSNNANSIISFNKHDGSYDSQLGFSSDGNMYYRNFNGTAIDTTTGWKTILDSANYTTYTVSKTGGGASGTWGISITGNADTVDSQHFTYSNNSNSPTYLWGTNTSGTNFLVNRANMSVNYAAYSGYSTRLEVIDNRGTDVLPNSYSNRRVTTFFNDLTGIGTWASGITVAGWDAGYSRWQIFGYSSTGSNDNLYFRSQTAGGTNTWNTLRTILHSGNYSSYALPLSGGTITNSIFLPLNLPALRFGNARNWDSAIAHDSASYEVEAFMTKSIGSKYRFKVGFDPVSFVNGSFVNMANADLEIGAGYCKINNNTVWHAGNDGEGSGLDADLLDGLNSSSFFHSYGLPVSNVNFNTYNFKIGTSFWAGGNGTGNSNYPFTYGQIVELGSRNGGYGHSLMLAAAAGNTSLYFRNCYLYDGSGGGFGSWKQIAFTDSNVESANKLKTPRTIWGQTFDGSGNVVGDLAMSSATIKGAAGQIYFGGNFHIDSLGTNDLHLNHYSSGNIYMNYGTTKGNTLIGGNVGIGTQSPGYKLDVVGTLRATGAVTLGSTLNVAGATYAPSLSALTIGVLNSDPTTGRGISLYGGPDNDSPTYGIMFAGTPTFGKHGSVTGDWATYFTMSDTTNRGWIFQRGTVNVASISAGGNAKFDGTLNVAGTTTLSSTLGVTGTITAQNGIVTDYYGSSWITMATRVNQIRGDVNATTSSAHSLYCVKNSNGDAIAFGGLGVDTGFYGFTATRISNNTNGTDWSTTWNVSTGKLSHSGDLYVGGYISSNSYITSSNRIFTGYDSGVANSMSCSGWFRSNGATGWHNATYGGGIYQDDSTYVKIYGNKAFKVTSTASDSINTSGGILASGNITAPRFVCSTNNQITTSGGYLALQTNGSNITVGGASSMYVNYLPAVGGTPTSWIWSAGSSTSWANFYIGSLNTYGPISCSSTITTASYVSSAQGYYKSGSSNDYVLLGSGSHKLISDFRLKSEKVLRMVFRGYFKWSGTNLTPSESDVVYSDFCTSYSISRVSTGRYRITFTGLKTTSNIAPDKTLQIFGAGRNINSSDGNPCYVAISNIDSSYFDIIIADDNTTNDNTSFTLYINQML